MRGLSLSGTGVGTSALYSCMPPTPRNGRIATDRTMIPMPPSHWIKLRHSKSAFGSVSIPVKMEAPVVVNPETDSKKASVKLVKELSR